LPKTARVFTNSMQYAVYVGLGLGASLMLFSSPLLRWSIGNDALDPRIFAAAKKYVCIRAMGMPAAAMFGTAQAACLGMQDAKSGLFVFGIASIVNLLLDLIMVRQPHPWIGGVAGAAWATMFAEYFSAWLFIKWLCTKSSMPSCKKDTATLQSPKRDGFRSIGKTLRAKNIGSIASQPENVGYPQSSNRQRFSTRGFLSGQFGFRQLIRPPNNDVSAGFTPYVVPITTTQMGRCSTYAAMGHVVSSSFGAISMAANQIILSIFYALIPIADSLSLTAQSLIPGIVAHNDDEQSTSSSTSQPRRSQILWKTSLNFLKAAGMMGLVQASIVAIIPWAGTLFTTDQAVLRTINSIVPVLLALFASLGVFCASEGILLGQRDLAFLGRMYGLFFVVIPWLMLHVKRLALAGNAAISLSSVWQVFLGYQAFRISAMVGRVLWLQRELHRQEQSRYF
jgi:Na+-driven multidrug efflux pump